MNKMLLTTTFALLREREACVNRYRVLRGYMGSAYPEDKPINLRTVLESNGVEDTVWCLRATQQECTSFRIALAAALAERLLALYAVKDGRPVRALRAARQFAKGEITGVEALAASREAVDAYNTTFGAGRDFAALAVLAASRAMKGESFLCTANVGLAQELLCKYLETS